jgi:Ca2+-binding EF-hand superfamily protein
MKRFTLFVGATMLAASAVYAEDATKTTNTSATAAFEALDKNADQQISKTEAASDKALADSFASADANGDGYLNKSEYAARTKS